MATAPETFPIMPSVTAELSRATIEIAKHIWPPDVIHCHDWQTALVPVLLRSAYAADPLVRDLPVVFTIHNLGYQGHFSVHRPRYCRYPS